MSDWDVSCPEFSLSALETKTAEEGARVDVRGVAAQDVVAVQDVGESPSA